MKVRGADDGCLRESRTPSRWTVLVQRLGLERHADAFEREEVELDLVSSLSDADLLELGIADAGVAGMC